MADAQRHVAALDDVELIRMLTRDAKNHSADILAAAEAEAVSRGLPIDEAFIPGDGGAGLPPQPETDQFRSGGRDIVCTQCGGNRFDQRKALLNTRGMTFLDLDWLNRGATALICKRCRQVQFFAS